MRDRARTAVVTSIAFKLGHRFVAQCLPCLPYIQHATHLLQRKIPMQDALCVRNGGHIVRIPVKLAKSVLAVKSCCRIFWVDLVIQCYRPGKHEIQETLDGQGVIER